MFLSNYLIGVPTLWKQEREYTGRLPPITKLDWSIWNEISKSPKFDCQFISSITRSRQALALRYYIEKVGY